MNRQHCRLNIPTNFDIAILCTNLQFSCFYFFWGSHFCIEYIPIRILEDLLFYSCSRKPTITRDQKTDRARVRCLGWVDLASFLSFHIFSAKKKSELICAASFLSFRDFCAKKWLTCGQSEVFLRMKMSWALSSDWL